MAIAPLQLPGYAAPTSIDWTPLDQLGKTLEENQKRMTLADLGQGIANGTIDYRQAAGKIAGTGNLTGTLSLLQLAEAKDKLAREQEASKAFTTSLASLYGGAPAAAPQPSPSVNSGPTVPNDDNAMPGTVGMNLKLADRTQDFIQDNPGTSLSSGVRTPQQQAALYANRANNPNPVAPPGTSLHETGNAADIAGMTPEQRAILPQYGLAQPVANDPPHVELAQGQDGGQPSAPATTAGVPSSALSPRAVQLIGAMANPNLPAAQKDIAKQMLASELDQSKMPDAVKQYVFAKSQDPSIGSFTDWTRGNKAAGKTEVNIDQKAETGEAMEAGKAAGKRRAEMFDAAGSATKTLTNLSRMETLLNQVQQGKIQPVRMNISAWAKSFGLNDDVARSIGLDPAGAGSAQALQSLINESVVGKIGKGGFPANNFSDADREFITKIFPSLGDDPQANKIRIEGARRMAQLDIERAKDFQKFKSDPENKGKGFEDFELQWADKVAKRDVFGDLSKKAEALTTQGSQPQAAPSEGMTATNPKTNERLIFKGGKWVPFT
ncbi:hypothetical protein BN961_02134 [Afipia felis]|uniref:Uncharacterized protein n=1 Tax=Afipia felis TaxID=1035 RepID=A0A090MMV4_AFIFE|nr:M15 family metallopeptidase [Afipia felis]CEG08716.1 hypothetical protein BN961_02134 [Afipia felis]